MRVDPLGHSTQRIYHPGLGVMTHVVEPSGVVQALLYDGFGRPAGAQRRSSPLGPSDCGDLMITRLAPVIPGSAAQAKAMAPAVFADLDAIDDLSARARLAECSSESLGRAIAIAAGDLVGAQQ